MLYFIVFYSLVTFMPFSNIFPLHLFKKYSKGIIFYWKGLEQGTRRGGRRWLPFFFFFHSNLLAPKEAFFYTWEDLEHWDPCLLEDRIAFLGAMIL